MGGDVVRHPRELVDRGDLEVQALGAGVQADGLDLVDRDRAQGGPGDVGQQAEDAVQVLAVRLDQAVAEQVQAQVRVVRVQRLVLQGGDHRTDGHDLDAADRVLAERLRRGGPQQFHGLLGGEALGAGRAGLGDQLGGGEPGVEDGAVGG
ncbi:hypothetical protein GCM10020254_62750 [Streptomyces goshikiensis]